MFRGRVSLARAALLIFLVFPEISEHANSGHYKELFKRREIKTTKLAGWRVPGFLGNDPNRNSPGGYGDALGRRGISRKFDEPLISSMGKRTLQQLLSLKDEKEKDVGSYN